MVIGHGKKGLQRIYDQHKYETETRETLTLWANRLHSIVEPPPANVIPITGQRDDSSAVIRYVDHILASVKHVPADLDRAQLLQELNSILAWYRLGVYHRSAPAKRHKDIEKIVATAKKLRALIEDNWVLVSKHDANLED